MKKFSKIICSLCALLLCFSCFVGCGNKVKDNENTVIIEMINAGYGRQFADDLKSRFEELNPGKTVSISATPFFGKIDAALRGGPKITKTDLFIAVIDPFRMISDGKFLDKDCLLEDLTDLYNAPAYNETLPIKDKMDSEYIEYLTVNDKIYTVPWASSLQGLIYNNEVFKKNNYTLPRTTDELFELADKIKASGKNAFMFAGQNDFFKFPLYTWWAQYEGIDNFQRFFEGKDENGDYSREIFKQDGRLEALKVVDKALSQQSGYCPADALAYDFPTAQYKFITGDAVMMPNGDWIENETRNSSKPGEVDLQFMKMPIISSLGTKLNITESELRAVVDYVDDATLTKPNVENGVIEKVRAARKMINTGGVSHNAFIPSYSNAIPLAKEFLKFMMSDEGHKIYINATSGATLPIKFDFNSTPEIYNSLTNLQKSKLKIIEDCTYVIEGKKSPLVFKGGMLPFQKGNVDPIFGGVGKDYMTAQDVFDFDYKYYTPEMFENLLVKAGL